ncbi:hypothetical protein F5141DRAFT_1060126 [Pisolithus sp. B1]|nr:hypothetical protein F5141DRAFT_1060126 [Pisolithus sp. B1]
MRNATIPTPPTCMPSPQSDRMVAMRSAAIPIPPVVLAASLPQPPLLNNLERMKIAVIPIPPSAATAPNTDWLEQMRNAMIPQAPLARIEMMDEQLQPPALTGGNVDHPHQSTSIEVADGQTQPSMITDVPTPDEHQALEQARLAMSDADDDFLHMLQTSKSQHGADFPPAHVPYNRQLDRHIVSQVQNVQAGQYMVDMIDLLEVLCHPHVGYSLQPYTRGWYANLCLDMCQEDQAQFQAEVQQIPLGTFRMINEISLFIPNWTPRSPNKYAGFVFPWWVDGSLQYMVDFEQMRGTRIFPIAHEYFQHTWPLQQLSMGDRIDEWMEEKWFALSRLLGLQDA